MKKLVSILGGIGVMALFAISFTFAYTQEQIDAYQWAYKHGITTQPTIEKAKLNANLTRQAFAKMVVNYLENVVGVKQSVSSSCSFPDESKMTNDLKPFVKKTCAYGIMGSNGKNFNPTQFVDRGQLGTVISRILWGDKYNVDGKGYYIYHLNALKDYGIMNKIDNPKVYAKRGDVMIMLKRVYETFGSDEDMYNGSQVSENVNIQVGEGYIWNNDNFLDENFWALNGGNPTDDNIKNALYGSSSSDTTAYTLGRSGWQWGVDCDVVNMNVVHVTTNDQIGNVLQKNTIYVLDVDNIQSDLGFTTNGSCIAVVSSLPSGSKVLTYGSDDNQANIYPGSFSILDNLSVDGVFNANGAKHGRNHHGINVWGAYNTLNNVNVYNAGHGIVTSVGQFNVFNNMKIFNNDGDGIRLIGSDYSSFNNMQIFNNRDAGINWSSTRSTNYNLFNNIQTYNNGVGIDITSESTNNKFNNVRVFNNNRSVINSNSTNTYNGLLDVFGNDFNVYGLTEASAQYGWTAGVQGSNSNGWSLWDLMTNPMSAGGNYLLNMGGSYGNARQVKNYILIDGYSYGNGILKQTQPVVWKGGNVVPVGNYDGSKFIGSM